MVVLEELERYCNELLAADSFDDYCPNGLQVDAGGREIRRLVAGVTASQALVDAAVESGADLLLVHHGYFWKGEQAALRGIKGNRVRALMQNGVSLLAYHLPLDAHL
ncbi:MAG: Nif3-like dinuclear metal center hexameric protein, partial [Sedimenticola sp.]